MEMANFKDKLKYWHIANCLTVDEREYFTEKNIEIGGRTYNYSYSEKREKWVGKFIGYPLTAVKDREFIKERIIRKLDI